MSAADAFRFSHHKHVSSADVFVHHEPRLLLASYPRPLTQRQREPAWVDTQGYEVSFKLPYVIYFGYLEWKSTFVFSHDGPIFYGNKVPWFGLQILKNGRKHMYNS